MLALVEKEPSDDSDDDWVDARCHAEVAETSDEEWPVVAPSALELPIEGSDAVSVCGNTLDMWPWRGVSPSKLGLYLYCPDRFALTRLMGSQVACEACDLVPSIFNIHLNASAAAAYRASRNRVNASVTSMLEYCRSSDTSRPITPALICRRLCYDGSPARTLKLESRVEVTSDAPSIIDVCTAPNAKVHVMDGSIQVILRKGPQLLNVKQALPMRLQFLMGGTGEDLYAARAEAELPALDAMRSHPCRPRFIDAVVTDDDGANARCEVMDDLSHSGGNRTKVCFKCTAHKKHVIVKQASSVHNCIDSKILRLCLAVRDIPQGVVALKSEMRRIACEQLEIVIGGVRSLAAQRFTEDLFNMCLPPSPENSRRRTLLTGIFNADLRVRGRITHIERGCCASPQHTLHLLCTAGVDALLPHGLPLYQKVHWTGIYATSSSLCLGANCHGMLLSALLRVVRTSKHALKSLPTPDDVDVRDGEGSALPIANDLDPVDLEREREKQLWTALR